MSKNYAEMARAFEACDIDASSFGHIEHLAVAIGVKRIEGEVAALRVLLP